MDSEDKHLVVAEVVVAGGYYLFAWLESFEDFIELRILTTDADFAAHCLSTFRRDYIYPFSSCLLVECTARDEDCAFRLAELEIQIVGLTCPDVRRLLSAESEVSLKLSSAYFRIYLADDCIIGLVLTLECC